MLGKTLAEVRALPYPEFRRWQIFYLLEPWGWWNEEYQTAAGLAMLYNVNRGKGKAKAPHDFARQMEAEVLKQAHDPFDALAEMSEQERREYIRAQIKKDFGIK